MGINLSTGANHEGSTAAHIATETGNLELVKWLTEHANELDETNGSTENTGSITGRTSSVAAMIESRDQFQVIGRCFARGRAETPLVPSPRQPRTTSRSSVYTVLCGV